MEAGNGYQFDESVHIIPMLLKVIPKVQEFLIGFWMVEHAHVFLF